MAQAANDDYYRPQLKGRFRVILHCVMNGGRRHG